MAGSSSYSKLFWLFLFISLVPLCYVIAVAAMSLPFCVFQGLNRFQYLNISLLDGYLPPAHCVDPSNRPFIPNGTCEALSLLWCEKNYVLPRTYTNQLLTYIFLGLATFLMLCVVLLLLWKACKLGKIDSNRQSVDICECYHSKRQGCCFRVFDNLTLQGPVNLPAIRPFQFPVLMLVAVFLTIVLLIVFACTSVLALSNVFLNVLPFLNASLGNSLSSTIKLVLDIVIYVLIATAVIALLVIVGYCFKMLRAFRAALEILVTVDQFGIDDERLTKFQRAEHARLLSCFEAIDWSSYGPHNFVRLFPISFLIAFLVLWLGAFLVCCIIAVYVVPLVLNPKNPQFWGPSITAFRTALIAVSTSAVNLMLTYCLKCFIVKPKLIGIKFEERLVDLDLTPKLTRQPPSSSSIVQPGRSSAQVF